MTENMGEDEAVARIFLVADDAGLSPPVDAAIDRLIGDGRLSGASFMANAGNFAAAARRALSWPAEAETGLHLTLTELAPLGDADRLTRAGTPPTIGRTILAAALGRLDRAAVAAEIGRQLARFRDAFGRDPDFVDGHQHVHLLAGVRPAVLGLFGGEGGLDPARTWLRDCAEPFARLSRRGVATGKAAVVSTLAGGLAAEAARAGVGVNDGFSGVYDFSTARPYVERFARFVAGTGPRPVVMVHPGAEVVAGDPIGPARVAEYEAFRSGALDAVLARAGVALARRGFVLGVRGAAEGAGRR